MPDSTLKKKKVSREDFAQKIKEQVITKPHEVVMAEKKQSIVNLLKSIFLGGVLYVIISYVLFRIDLFSQKNALYIGLFTFVCVVIVYTFFTQKLIRDRR